LQAQNQDFNKWWFQGKIAFDVILMMLLMAEYLMMTLIPSSNDVMIIFSNLMRRNQFVFLFDFYATGSRPIHSTNKVFCTCFSGLTPWIINAENKHIFM